MSHSHTIHVADSARGAQALALLRCPRCKGMLGISGDEVACRSCGSRYPVVGPIPDLRVPGAAWVDFDEDRANARKLLTEIEGQSAERVIHRIFNARPGWSEARSEL